MVRFDSKFATTRRKDVAVAEHVDKVFRVRPNQLPGLLGPLWNRRVFHRWDWPRLHFTFRPSGAVLKKSENLDVYWRERCMLF